MPYTGSSVSGPYTAAVEGSSKTLFYGRDGERKLEEKETPALRDRVDSTLWSCCSMPLIRAAQVCLHSLLSSSVLKLCPTRKPFENMKKEVVSYFCKRTEKSDNFILFICFVLKFYFWDLQSVDYLDHWSSPGPLCLLCLGLGLWVYGLLWALGCLFFSCFR